MHHHSDLWGYGCFGDLGHQNPVGWRYPNRGSAPRQDYLIFQPIVISLPYPQIPITPYICNNNGLEWILEFHAIKTHPLGLDSGARSPATSYATFAGRQLGRRCPARPPTPMVDHIHRTSGEFHLWNHALSESFRLWFWHFYHTGSKYDLEIIDVFARTVNHPASKPVGRQEKRMVNAGLTDSTPATQAPRLAATITAALTMSRLDLIGPRPHCTIPTINHANNASAERLQHRSVTGAAPSRFSNHHPQDEQQWNIVLGTVALCPRPFSDSMGAEP